MGQSFPSVAKSARLWLLLLVQLILIISFQMETSMVLAAMKGDCGTNNRQRLKAGIITEEQMQSQCKRVKKGDANYDKGNGVWATNKDAVIPRKATRYYPWLGDPECEQYFVRFAPEKAFEPRALISFACSGNSWLRYLIEASSGYFTGSLFNEPVYFRAGMLGEMRQAGDGSTILQKAHHDGAMFWAKHCKAKESMEKSETLFKYRGILLIRNPYEALVSHWHLRKTANHTGLANTEPNYKDKHWIKHVEICIEKWTNVITTWITKSDDLLIILYEDLKNDPAKELRRILQHLDQPIDEARVECVMRHLEGPFLRKGTAKTATQAFRMTTDTRNQNKKTVLKPSGSRNLVDVVQEQIDKVNEILKSLKKYNIFLNYKVPSEYVSQQ